jgi:RNA polymerase sigma factor (sigma-70 family)
VTALEHLNTAEFLAELKGGSTASFERLAEDLFTPLWRFLAGTRNVPEADADELVQDVLLKVYFKIGTYQRDGRATLTTWIFQIANNQSKDFHELHRQELEELTENTEPDHWEGVYAGRNRAYLQWLRGELEKLTAADQQVLIWRAQDFTYVEIGRWLGIKEGTARVRYLRAKRKLGVPDDPPVISGTATGQHIQESGDAHE